MHFSLLRETVINELVINELGDEPHNVFASSIKRRLWRPRWGRCIELG
jgi:hypothetical protein